MDVEIHAVPLTVDGGVRGGYGLYQDVTKRKRAEEALRESEERYGSGRVIETVKKLKEQVTLNFGSVQ